MRSLSWPLLAFCFGAVASVVSAAPKGVMAQDRIAGGEHWHLQTPYGGVHVWRPAGYSRGTAGTVLYVHGFSLDVDAAWERHQLAKQFEASRRNAIFVVPEAPTSPEETVRWPSLNTLLSTVGSRLALAWPTGPLVVVGHSGAHVTVMPWLKTARLGQIVLLDAVYGHGMAETLRAWLLHRRGRLVLVDTAETAEDSERVVHGVPGVVRRGRIPESSAEFTSRDRKAQVEYLRSQYTHTEMVSEGKAIAPLLSLTRLSAIAVPQKPGTKARPRH
jgi:hypothetical protein